MAGAKERLLILTFTVQNPLSREQRLGASSFSFTAVSPDDENSEFRGYLLHGTKKTRLDQDLKPAQKVKCIAVFPIYATGPISKLLVRRGTGAVLRYDLSDKTQKMTSVFSPDGIDLGDVGPTLKPGDPAAGMGPFAVSYEGISYTTEPILGQAPSPGERYLCVDVKFTNAMLMPAPIGFQFFTPELLDGNGEKISWNSELISRTNTARLSQDVAPWDSVGGRYYFRIPSGRAPRVCRFTHQPSQRKLSFDVQGHAILPPPPQ